MSCIQLSAEITKWLSTSTTTQRHEWFTDWMPAVGLDKVRCVYKSSAGNGEEDLDIQPCYQIANVRTNQPEIPCNYGTGHAGNGEWVTAGTDLTADTAGAQYIRFGMTYKASSAGEAQADVSMQICVEVYGKVVATNTLTLLAPDTTGYFTPISGWFPSSMVGKIKAALVVTRPAANFKVGLAYQVASTSVEDPGTWTLAGSLYGSGERNTGEQTISYGSPQEMWIRLGLKYVMDSGTNGDAVVSFTAGIRK